MTVRLPIQRRDLLLAVAGVFCLAVFFHFVFSPLLGRLKGIHQESKGRAKVFEELVKLTGHADEITNAYPRYEQYVQAGLAREAQEGIFLKDIETLAKSSAVQIVSQQPCVVRDSPDFLDMDLRIELEARLRDIIVFLDTIDSSEKLMRITQMRLVPRTDAGARTFRCQVDISKRYIK